MNTDMTDINCNNRHEMEINAAIAKELKNNFFGDDTTCVIYKDGIIFEHTGGSIAPVADAWFCGDLEDAVVVDKVIGKASAMFMADGNAAYVHGKLISEPAQRIMEINDMSYSYDENTPKIINRTGDGLCPMESAVMDTDNLQDGIARVFDKMNELGML